MMFINAFWFEKQGDDACSTLLRLEKFSLVVQYLATNSEPQQSLADRGLCCLFTRASNPDGNAISNVSMISA
jgi:hypothetical protein